MEEYLQSNGSIPEQSPEREIANNPAETSLCDSLVCDSPAPAAMFAVPMAPTPETEAAVFPPAPPMTGELKTSPILEMAEVYKPSPVDAAATAEANGDGDNIFSQTNCFTGLDVGRAKNGNLTEAIAEEGSECDDEASVEAAPESVVASFAATAPAAAPAAAPATKKPPAKATAAAINAAADHSKSVGPNDLVVVGQAVQNMDLSEKIHKFLEALTEQKRVENLKNKPAPTAPNVSARLTKATHAQAAKKATRVTAAAKEKQPTAAPRRMSLTVTREFQLSRRQSTGSLRPKLTTEELQLKQAATAMALQSKRVLQNQRMHARAKSGATTSVARSTKSLTIPASPALVTKQLLGEKVPVEPSPVPAPKHTYDPTKLTVPAAPKFRSSMRARASTGTMPSEAELDLPLAEQVYKLEHSVPDRFHEKAKGPAKTNFTGKLTVPRSPNLHHVAQKTKLATKSFQEQEDEIIEEGRKHQFKARPLNRKIIECGGTYGVPKVTSNSTTVPEAFSFGTTHRPSTAGAPSKDEQEMAFKFKARPMPKQTSMGGCPGNVRSKNLTVPQSPHLHTANRPRTAPTADAENQENVPPSKATTARRRSTFSKTLTEVKPFNLSTESRGAVHADKLHRRVAGEERETKFHARQMPNFSNGPDFIPQASEKPLTEFEAFNLQSVERHERKVAEFQQRVAEELQPKAFHARPVPRTSMDKGFVVEYHDRSPLQPRDVNLASSTRAAARAEFDKANAQRVANEAMTKKQMLEKRLRDEEKIVKQMRRRSIEQGGMAFKAKEVEADRIAAAYKPETSKRELTVPVTPELATMARSEFRKAIQG